MFTVQWLILVMLVGDCHSLLDGLQDQLIQQRFDALALEIQQLKEKVAVLENNTNGTNVTGPIAFTAGLSQTLTNVGTHQHIVFDNIITNIGNAYKASDGHFVAPIRGAYVFYAVLTNVPRHSSSAQLLKNGKWIGRVLAHGDTNDDGMFVTSTIVVTVQMEKGDEVWVQNEYAFSTVEEIDGGNWSYFSGHLISAN